MAHAVSIDRWQTMSYGFQLHGNYAQIAANGGRLYIVVDVGDAVVGTMYIYGYQNTTRQWERVDQNNASRFITVDSNCQLYQLHNTGHIFRYTGTPNQWERVDANAATNLITADSDGRVYQRHNTGDIYRYLGTPYQWERIGGKSPSSTILELDGDDSLVYRRENFDEAGGVRRAYVLRFTG